MPHPELKRALRHALTVKELRDALEDLPDDAPVVFSYTANDYWHTVISPVVSDVIEGAVEWSDYHCTPQLADEGDDDAVAVVILS